MPLKNLPFKPGIYSDETDRDVGKLGYWIDCDKVRFRDGMPAMIGGWIRGVDDAQFLGVARGATDWRSYRSEIFLAFGTHLKLYVWVGGEYFDITPYRDTGTLTNPFTTTIGLTEVGVADVAHGLSVGDYVHFSGASAVGGITVDGVYTVTTAPTADSYTITHSVAASSTAGPGGGTVTYAYEIPIGRADSVYGLGWGTGGWGLESWGTPRTLTDILALARTWSIDQWGEDVVCNYRGGGIYVWDSSGGTSARASVITQAPISARSIFVSTEDRHLVALGAHDGVGPSAMNVRWCDQENYTDWTPSLTNTAGDKLLDIGSEILCGAKVRGEHLIFTDAAIYSMVFVGPPDTFGFRPLGDNGGLLGPLAVHVFEGVAYWMGEKDFFMYDGVTKVIPCTINTTVFDDFNYGQRAKVYCGVNRKYREVWWLYPSENSTECDRYAIYNLLEGSWSYGTLDRTMLIGDSDVFSDTYGFGADGYIYTHETGTSANGSNLNAYIESGAVELDDAGNSMQHISKFIPDLKDAAGTLNLTISAKKYPQATEIQSSGPHALTPTTEFVNPRVRGRQVILRFESDATDTNWRLGMPRVELVPHGRR